MSWQVVTSASHSARPASSCSHQVISTGLAITFRPQLYRRYYHKAGTSGPGQTFLLQDELLECKSQRNCGRVSLSVIHWWLYES